MNIYTFLTQLLLFCFFFQTKRAQPLEELQPFLDTHVLFSLRITCLTHFLKNIMSSEENECSFPREQKMSKETKEGSVPFVVEPFDKLFLFLVQASALALKV